ncbi:MAG: PqiC family protein [Gammaproteobacteria bacterium]|nr:PqiC family protein [Gammaproteobacteria bacterium]
MSFFRKKIRVIFLLSSVFFNGCAIDLHQHYLLSAITPTNTLKNRATPLLLILKPLELPNYVKQAQILTREQGSSVSLSKSNLWAEPMINGVERVLIQDLAQRIEGEVLPYAQRLQAKKIDYFILVSISDFIGTLGQEALLSVQWQILDGKRQKTLRFKRQTYRETLSDYTYETLVMAQSRLLASLSDDLAQAVVRLADE